jgi:hypothetical protein
VNIERDTLVSRKVSPELGCIFTAALLISPIALICEFLKRPEFAAIKIKIFLLIKDPDHAQGSEAKGPSMAERGRARREKKAD